MSALLLISAGQALAQAPLPVSIAVFEDTQNSLKPTDVLNSPGSFTFSPIDRQHNFGISRTTFWFKIDIPALPEAQQLVLDISYPLLDIVDIYTQENSAWTRLELGDTRPFSNREIAHHNFLKILDAAAQKPLLIFLRIRSEGPIIVPIKVWEMVEFHHQDHNRTLREGLYFGVLLALVLFNLFVYLSIRNPSYLYYVGYLGFITLFLSSLQGLITQYLLPDSPLLTNRLPFVSLYLALIIAFKFTSSINNTQQISPGLVKIFNLYSLALFGVLLTGLFIGVHFLSQITPYLAIAAIALYTHAIVLGIKAGFRPSYYVGLAFLMLVPGAILYGLRTLSLVDTGNWPELVFQTGIVLEALLLSLVLAYRVRYIQTRLEQVQHDADQERHGFAKKLIETRDLELQQLAMELHDGLGQNLLAIKNKLSRILRQNHEDDIKAKATYDAYQITQSTIDDVRQISHQLHPHILDRLGLKEAIIQVTHDTCDGRVNDVRYNIDDIKLPKNSPVALHIYRIIQEAVKNCAVHAGAERIDVSLTQEAQTLLLHIEDYPAQAQAQWLDTLDYNKSFGLSNILQRVKLLGGDVQFSHNNLAGLTITITIPLKA